MKTIFTYLFIIAILTTSCEKPIASFYVSSHEIDKGEGIAFTNTSSHSDEYLWIFGDGERSTDSNPYHIYNKAGNFTVGLIAGNENSRTLFTQKIVVKNSTDIIITVIDYFTDLPKTNYPLSVYSNFENYTNKKNSDFSGLSNKNGEVLIPNYKYYKYCIIDYYNIIQVKPDTLNYFTFYYNKPNN